MASMNNNTRFDSSMVNRCLLCFDAPCSKACPSSVAVSDVLRSLYFDNPSSAVKKLEKASCLDCNAPCEKACLIKSPVKIRDIFISLEKEDKPQSGKIDVDLSTEICGVKLENPFLLSSSVVASTYEMCARAFSSGWAGASFKTICSFDQHETSPRFSAIWNHSNSFAGFKNIEQLSNHTIEEDLAIFRRLKAEFPTKVIIASIMGKNEEEWTYIASECEKAGADVIECNFSCPNMEDSSLGSTIGQDASQVERFTRAVRKGTKLPILAKLTPNVADMVPMALAAKRGGADGIAAINTIYSITGVDIDDLVAEPAVRGRSIVGGYSGAAVKPIALRFISDLSNTKELEDMHISGMGGIETWRDGLEFLLLGCGSLQVTTAVMQYGYRIIEDLVSGLRSYMETKGIKRVSELIGKASSTVVEHTQIERDTVVYPIIDREKCNGCLRCYISCQDGGHQAIIIQDGKLPKIDGKACVGCHLCKLVCPLGAIELSKKAVKKK